MFSFFSSANNTGRLLICSCEKKGKHKKKENEEEKRRKYRKVILRVKWAIILTDFPPFVPRHPKSNIFSGISFIFWKNCMLFVIAIKVPS